MRHVGASGVVLVLGAVALGCGDPDGPPARSVASAAPVVTATPTPEHVEPLAAPRPLVVNGVDDVSIGQLVTALRGDPDPDERRRAIDAYARRVTTDCESSEPLLEAVATDLDPLVRRWAALALASAATPDLRPRLRALAASERDPVVRSILERAHVEHEARSAHPGGRR